MHSFFFRLRIKMVAVLYILEAFRNNNILPGLLLKRTRKGIEQQPIFFFGYGSKCLSCYISKKRSGIITSCQDFYLRKPERIENNCLIFFFFRLRFEMLNVLYMLDALRHSNIMPGLLPGQTRKDIKQPPNFFFRLRIKMLNVFYILDALRNKNIIPRTSTQVNQKGYRTIAYLFFRLRIKIPNVLYILEVLRHNNIMPGLLPE